jgi:hypothetical protein
MLRKPSFAIFENISEPLIKGKSEQSIGIGEGMTGRGRHKKKTGQNQKDNSPKPQVHLKWKRLSKEVYGAEQGTWSQMRH